MKSFCFLLTGCAALAAPSLLSAQGAAREGNPADHLPPHIRRLTGFGERADWSHDGKRVLFLSKTFGDAMELDIETGSIRNLTAHYPHHGYTRALYLSNGDVLLSGPQEFDPRHAGNARVQCFLYVLDKALSGPAAPLGTKCSEGPAVSRRRLHIAWTHVAAEYPDSMPAGSSRMQEADIVYEGGSPRLASERLIIDSRDLPFRCTLETQNFRPPEEKELLFSAYGHQGTDVCGIELSTRKVTNYSNAPDQYDEPEGIFPDGRHILVECDRQNHQGSGHVDLWKLALDGSGSTERLTQFSDFPGYKASNPVVSDDGRWIAFQMAKSREAAGVGHGIFVLDTSRAAGERTSFPDVERLPESTELPDPLRMLNGAKVASREQWEKERRPELKALFQHYMYGYFPPPPGNTRGTVRRADAGLFGGKATLKEVAVSFGPPECPPIDLLLVVPNRRQGPAPVFLGLNFTGNHTLLADPGVALPRSWMRPGPGVEGNRATEAGRGRSIDAFAIEQSIDRGYAVATFYYGDALPDKDDFQDGIYPYFLPPGRTEPGPDDWGAIACWAWGLHRAVDYLRTDPDIDRARIAVTGHSRNGKAALLAAAFDERIALVIPHQAGCGGTGPSRARNPKAETVKAINERFPHWFDDVFPRFNEAVERLPFDQHCLAALCAPRPVLFTNGLEDQWANPEGQFEMLKAAEPVYRLLGAGGLETAEMPPLGELSSGVLGYYIRAGGHVSDPAFWKVFLDYADRHLKPRPGG